MVLVVQRSIDLDVVPVASAFFLLGHIAVLGQFIDHAEDASLGEVERRGDFSEAHLWIACDADENPGMVGQKAPGFVEVAPVRAIGTFTLS